MAKKLFISESTITSKPAKGFSLDARCMGVTVERTGNADVLIGWGNEATESNKLEKLHASRDYGFEEGYFIASKLFIDFGGGTDPKALIIQYIDGGEIEQEC